MSRAGLVAAAGIALACVVLGPASARTSRYGGTLVVGDTSGAPSTLDPTLNNGTPAATIDRAICLRLYEYAGNHGRLELAPVLAAAPPAISADKLSYTVQLRQGIEFNDGTPFNAQAVVTSYRRYTTYPGSAYASAFAGVDNVTATGPYTVVYRLKQRDSTFTGNMYVLSPTALANEGANFGAHPVCVGPFMFDHWIPGDNVTLVKSPYYYKRAAVHLDKIVYKPLTDAAAAVAALQAGDVQVLTSVLPTLVPQVQKDASLRVLDVTGFTWNGIVINIGNKHGVGNLPYQNVGTPLAQSAKLRQAFEEAIDRKTLNRVVFDGLYQPSCTLIPPSDTEWSAATKVTCTPYNPADAKKLVAESGFRTPITVHYLTFPNTTQQLVAQFIQAEEAAVGINLMIDSIDIGSLDALRAPGNFDVTIATTTSDPEPNSLIYNRFATSGSTNYGGYSNPRLDYVLTNALKATSFKARALNYRVAQQIIHDDRPVIVFYNPILYTAFSTSLTGIALTPTGALSVANAQFK